MPDDYMDTKKELDRLKHLFRRLHMKKEQEIALRRVGKRLSATEIKEVREMEATISAILERPGTLMNAQQRCLFDNFKNQYQASMRGWRNRLAFAEQSHRRRRARLSRPRE